MSSILIWFYVQAARKLEMEKQKRISAQLRVTI